MTSGRDPEPIRQFVFGHLRRKFGAALDIQQPKLFRSAAFYSTRSAICAIFIAEVQLKCDESFKVLCRNVESAIETAVKPKKLFTLPELSEMLTKVVRADRSRLANTIFRKYHQFLLEKWVSGSRQ